MGGSAREGRFRVWGTAVPRRGPDGSGKPGCALRLFSCGFRPVDVPCADRAGAARVACLRGVCCALWVACCMLPVAQLILPVACCKLSACWLHVGLHVACCIIHACMLLVACCCRLHGACCIRRVACCTLHAVADLDSAPVVPPKNPRHEPCASKAASRGIPCRVGYWVCDAMASARANR